MEHEEDLSDSKCRVDWDSNSVTLGMSGAAPAVALRTLYGHGGGMDGDRVGADRSLRRPHILGQPL